MSPTPRSAKYGVTHGCHHLPGWRKCPPLPFACGDAEEGRTLRCALACCRYFASKGPIGPMGPIGDSIFLALIVDAAHLLPLFAEMGLMGPIGDSIFVALIVDGGVLLPLFAEMRRGCRGAASGVISWIFWTSWRAWRFHRGRGVHRRLALCLGMPCRGSWGVPFRLS